MGKKKALPQRTACGFVLTRAKGPAGLEYLALINRRREDAGLPKGHMDAGETEMQTALRETEEETSLTDLEILGDFQSEMQYEVTRKKKRYLKRVVYFTARLRSGKVRLSQEHSAFEWLSLDGLLKAMPFPALTEVVRAAALFQKDPALFDLEPATEADARAHLITLPEARPLLLAHLNGGARLARRFAEALAEAGAPIHVEATAAGTLLHDVGRAIGEHADHQRAGLRHLRQTPLAAYGYACISHFTKGADAEALLAAGLSPEVADDFRRLIDISTLTWEERCAALADACMQQDKPVAPAARFADLRERYDAEALISLQERQTEIIRKSLHEAIGHDPLELVGLSGP